MPKWNYCKSEVCLIILNQPTPQLSLAAIQSFSRVWLFETPRTAARQAPLSSVSPGVCSDSRPLSRWCHSTISSSVAPCPPALNLSVPWILSWKWKTEWLSGYRMDVSVIGFLFCFVFYLCDCVADWESAQNHSRLLYHILLVLEKIKIQNLKCDFTECTLSVCHCKVKNC